MSAIYDEVLRRSLADREAFWAEAAEDLSWTRKWDRVLDDSNAPFYRWFRGGRLNTCYNALDVHVEQGRAEQPASGIALLTSSIRSIELCGAASTCVRPSSSGALHIQKRLGLERSRLGGSRTMSFK